MPENKSKITEKVRQELKELTTSISAMMEAFRKIRQPIQESSVKVPTTAHHLEKVTEQTERATHKVLDMIEDITNRESQISGWVEQIKKMIPDEVLSSNTQIDTLLTDIKVNAEGTLNDSYNIMDALQFQDITTQQIDHAISLLDDVEDKLVSMLQTVGVKSADQPDKKSARKVKAFDPNAGFSADNPTQQQEIDRIISKME
jgi:chemotaxis regulatin CheY-phosphate phosphatase CheZ